jgi:biopolymer transport protein ExbD
MGRMRAAASADEGPLASINIIPFVDIVLVLLVIFMLTSAVIMRATMKVDLPKAAAGGATVESTVNLVLTKEGTLLLNGESVPEEQARAFIRGEVASHPKLQAVIAADKAVDYGRVMALIDLVKGAGVTSFALDVEKSGGVPQPVTSPGATPTPATPAPAGP